LTFVKGTVAGSSFIIPIIAQLKYDVDTLNESIVKPFCDFSSDPRLIAIWSFDVKQPGAEIGELKSCFSGKSILTGVLRLGMEVEIRPGRVTKDSTGRSASCRCLLRRNSRWPAG